MARISSRTTLNSPNPSDKPVKPQALAKKKKVVPVAAVHPDSQITVNSRVPPKWNSNKPRTTRKLHITGNNIGSDEEDGVPKVSAKAFIGNKRKYRPDSAQVTTEPTQSKSEGLALFIVLDEDDSLLGHESSADSDTTSVDSEGDKQARHKTSGRDKTKSLKNQPKRVRNQQTTHAELFHQKVQWAARAEIQFDMDYSEPEKYHVPFVPGRFAKSGDNGYYDQQEMLVMKVMDMSRNRNTGKPKMNPVSIKLHPPKDWDNKRAIHRLNIDRSQKLRRTTETRQRDRKLPFEQEERDFIANQMKHEKKPSIKLLTANFNQQFQGKLVGNYHKPREERTQASISTEYCRNKGSYDDGHPPQVAPIKPRKNEFAPREQREIRDLLARNPRPQLSEIVDKFNSTFENTFVYPFTSDERPARTGKQIMAEYKAYQQLYDSGYAFPNWPLKNCEDNFGLVEREFLAEHFGQNPKPDIERVTEALNKRFMGDYVDPFSEKRTERTVNSVRLEYQRFYESYNAGIVPPEMDVRKQYIPPKIKKLLANPEMTLDHLGFVVSGQEKGCISEVDADSSSEMSGGE